MKGGGQNNKKEGVAVAGVKRAGGDHGKGASVGGKPVEEGSEAMEGIEEKEGEEDWGDDSPPTEGKRRRLEGAALGVGVREAIYEEIVMGRKAVRFGVVTSGTPYWEWAVPAGVFCVGSGGQAWVSTTGTGSARTCGLRRLPGLMQWNRWTSCCSRGQDRALRTRCGPWVEQALKQ